MTEGVLIIEIDKEKDVVKWLKMSPILRGYKKRKKPMQAALMYSFETFIQSFLTALKGKSYLESHVALGRSDLIINILDSEWVIEAKIFYNAAQYTDGKTQLAYYIKSLGLNRGIYLVFVDKQVTNPYILEGTEVIEDVDIITYIVRYDLEIDFSEPRKAKLPPKKKGQQKRKKKP